MNATNEGLKKELNALTAELERKTLLAKIRKLRAQLHSKNTSWDGDLGIYEDIPKTPDEIFDL